MKKINIGIVGISGLVGSTILQIIDEYKIDVGNIVLYGSKRSAGKAIEYKGKEYIVVELTPETIDPSLDIVFFAAGGDISKEYCSLFTLNKTYVIDNSSVFRLQEDVALVVPEINVDDISKDNYLIANPNCTTIQSVIPLKVIDDLYGVERVDFTSYQAVSGSGYEGINDLENGTTNVYPYQINDNLIPLIDDYQDNGFSKEEQKMINETRKILNKPAIEIAATCIRVPIKNTHGVSVRVQVKDDIDIETLLIKLASSSGIVLKNDTKNSIYPVRSEVDGQDSIHVGRLRKDLYSENILHFYCVGDNLRKGAASNSVQIALHLIDKYI